jgi:hypothetical protein
MNTPAHPLAFAALILLALPASSPSARADGTADTEWLRRALNPDYVPDYTPPERRARPPSPARRTRPASPPQAPQPQPDETDSEGADQESLPQPAPREAARPAPQESQEELTQDAADRAPGVGAEQVAESFKAKGYRCTDTPDRQGIFCVGGSRTYVTIPRGISEVKKLVFYAHGLVGVCGNGASGELYLKNESPTLRKLSAVAVMPWRQSAGNTGYPLAGFIRSMDQIIGAELPLLLAGHSAAGPFFATELNGNGAGILGRVEKVYLLDAIYGDQASRWNRVLARNTTMRLHMLSTTTAARARSLHSRIESRFRSRVKMDNLGGGHCDIPRKYFGRLAE